MDKGDHYINGMCDKVSKIKCTCLTNDFSALSLVYPERDDPFNYNVVDLGIRPNIS